MKYEVPIVNTKYVCYGRSMETQPSRNTLKPEQLHRLNKAVSMAEELVSNHFKMSASQWLRPKYDIKTLADLSETEIIEGPFAQIIRYQGKHKGSALGSRSYDFYKICIQDHNILNTLSQNGNLELLPFCLYIVTHELVHIVRFSKFLQSFDATDEEKLLEETRVHETTHKILGNLKTTGLKPVLNYFQKWRFAMDELGIG